MKYFEKIIPYLMAVFPIAGWLLRDYVGLKIDYITGVLVMGLAGFIIFLKFFQKRFIRIPHYLIFFGIFVAYTHWAAAFLDGYMLDRGIWKFFYTDDFLRSLLLLFIVENINYDLKNLRIIKKILYGVVVFSVGVTLVQTLFDPYFLMKPLESFAMEGHIKDLKEIRNPSIYSWTGSLSLGFSFVSLISILYGLGLMRGKKSPLLLIGGALVVFLNLSRWIMLNFVIVVFQGLMVEKRPVFQFFKYTFLVVGIGILGYFALPLIGIDVGYIFENRLADDSANTRLLALELFLEHFPQQPLFGTGGRMTDALWAELAGRSSQIHVGYLSLFYYYGLLGGTVYMIFCYLITRRMLRTARMTGFYGSFFAVLGFMVANLTLVHLPFFQHGLILAIIFNRYFEQILMEGKQDTLPELIP